MLEIRLTVFRDKPSPELLKAHAPAGYYLFWDNKTQTYFLTTGEPGRFAPSPFWAGYDPILDLPLDFDTSYLKAFKKAHSDLFDDTLIHEDIIKEAVALSKAFATRVLCVYSNDEACDFAVTAENGRLLRLRFQAGREQGKRLEDGKAKSIDTEIEAVRLYPDKVDPENDGVFEYTAYEVIQTEESPPTLRPYWVYLEGEINRRAVFRTVKYEPEDMASGMLFRNGFLEFEEAFGVVPPDFTDMADPERFKQNAFQPPPKKSKPPFLSKLFLGIEKYFLAKPKRMLWTAGIVLILALGIFGEREEKPQLITEFEKYCMAAGGSPVSPKSPECRIGNQIYENWNLPGEKNERRIMVLIIAPETEPCETDPAKACLRANGAVFEAEIEGFTFTQGKAQIVPVERIRLCDPKTEEDCEQLTQRYQFRKIADLQN